MYQICFSKKASKDKELLKQAGLDKKARWLLDIISADPFQIPPPYEKLVGDLKVMYSRRINYTHRLVYKVEGDDIVVLSMWSRCDL